MTGKRPQKQAPAATEENKLEAEPPEYLSDHGKTIWRETIADLESQGRPVNRLNRQALVGFCEAAAVAHETGQILAREGYTIDGGRDGPRKHPAGSLRIAALNSLRAFAAELGLTPGSSGRLPEAPKFEKERRFKFKDL